MWTVDCEEERVAIHIITGRHIETDAKAQVSKNNSKIVSSKTVVKINHHNVQHTFVRTLL